MTGTCNSRAQPGLCRLGDTGLEHPARIPAKTQFSETGGAESGAPEGETAPETGPETDPSDPELEAIIRAWPALPEAVRAGIVAMVRAATGKPE